MSSTPISDDLGPCQTLGLNKIKRHIPKWRPRQTPHPGPDVDTPYLRSFIMSITRGLPFPHSGVNRCTIQRMFEVSSLNVNFFLKLFTEKTIRLAKKLLQRRRRRRQRTIVDTITAHWNAITNEYQRLLGANLRWISVPYRESRRLGTLSNEDENAKNESLDKSH